MQYAKHNFKKNFLNANGSKDSEATKDILLNELADLIAHSPNEVAEALRKSNVKLSDKPSARQLANAVIDNLATNKELIKHLAVLIAQKNKEVYANDTGPFGEAQAPIDTVKGPTSSNTKVSGDTVTSVANALGNIFGFFSKRQENKAAQEAYKKQLLMNLQTRGVKTAMPLGAKIAIGVAIAALLGTTIFIIVKSVKKK